MSKSPIKEPLMPLPKVSIHTWEEGSCSPDMFFGFAEKIEASKNVLKITAKDQHGTLVVFEVVYPERVG